MPGFLSIINVLSISVLDVDRMLTLWINGSHNFYWDNVVYTATSTFMWLPLACVLLWILYKNLSLRQFCLFLVCIGLTIAISDQLSSAVFKPLFQRWRPTNDPLYMYVVDVVHGYRGGRYGFFSAHASNTFAVATLLSFVFRKKRLIILLYLWALINCYTRIYLGVHYVGDVLVGILIGLSIGSIIGSIYCKKVLCSTPSIPPVTVSPSSQLLFECSCLFSFCALFIVAAFLK